MDVGLIKAFLEVNRTRHFGQAANNLFLSQSAVSARIRQLEEVLGVSLFTRDRNNISLTPAGEKFLRYAENILNAWNRACQEIGVSAEMRTLVTVAAVPSLWDIYLDQWLVWARKTYPEIAILADAVESSSLLRRLQEGMLDLGVLFDPPQSSQLNAEEIAPVPLVLVSTQAGLTCEEAMRQDYVRVDWGTSFGVQHANLFPDIAAPSLRVGMGRLAHSYLLNGGGSAYLPQPMITSDLGTTLHLVADAPVIHRKAYLVYALSNEKKDILVQFTAWFHRE